MAEIQWIKQHMILQEFVFRNSDEFEVAATGTGVVSVERNVYTGLELKLYQ